MNTAAGIPREERRRRYLAKQERIATGTPELLRHSKKPRIPHVPPTTTTDDDDTENDPGNIDATVLLWMKQHSHMCQTVTLDDIHRIQQQYRSSCSCTSDRTTLEPKPTTGGGDDTTTATAATTTTTTTTYSNTLSPPEQHMRHLNHYLAPYFDLQQNKDLPISHHVPTKHVVVPERKRQRFIAEGTETIRILLMQQQQQIYHKNQKSDSLHASLWQPNIQIESILIKPNLFFDVPVQLQRDVDTLLCTTTTGNESLTEEPLEQNDGTPPPLPPFQILLASIKTMSAVAGFTVSRGCLACGYIPIHQNETWFWEQLHRHITTGSITTTTTTTTTTPLSTPTLRLLALDGISDTANLGAMIRTSSAFGIHAILLSHDCCDAWYRRSIRVSMGHVFRIPIVRVTNLSHTLEQLSLAPYNVTSYAAVVDANTSIALHQIKHGTLFFLLVFTCFDRLVPLVLMQYILFPKYFG